MTSPTNKFRLRRINQNDNQNGLDGQNRTRDIYIATIDFDALQAKYGVQFLSNVGERG